jgi:hypothetical protein
VEFQRDGSFWLFWSANHSHFISSDWFCTCRSIILSPPNRLGRVTRFHGTKQCPPENLFVVPRQRNLRVIFVSNRQS